MYLVYLENWVTKERVDIGIFSVFLLAEQAANKASAYWNEGLEENPFLFTIVSIAVDKLPDYL